MTGEPQAPDAAALRAQAAALDERERKIIAAMVVRMIDGGDAVRDREWISEQFVGVLNVALAEDESIGSTSEGVDRVQAYATERAPTLLPLAFGIFGQVAMTLQERGEPITMEAAVAEVMAYVGE